MAAGKRQEQEEHTDGPGQNRPGPRQGVLGPHLPRRCWWPVSWEEAGKGRTVPVETGHCTQPEFEVMVASPLLRTGQALKSSPTSVRG